MLNVNQFIRITKVINKYENENFNYIVLLNELNREGIEVQRYKLEKYFFFLKKWNFVDNINGRKPFVLKGKIPLNMVKYLCDFTDLNEMEREEFKNICYRDEKIKKVKSKINI